MPRIALTDSFLEALAALDAADAKRVATFIDKLLHAPEASSLKPEIVHDAADRTVRSLRVTHDLRAIGHVDGKTVLLLHVARHDRAYAWARGRCITCHARTRELWLVSEADGAKGERLVPHACATSGDLCRLLERFGIEHGLAG
jgi:mRNA-degrading endonuclease RelE of RelBE toxin-antitoxin system